MDPEEDDEDLGGGGLGQLASLQDDPDMSDDGASDTSGGLAALSGSGVDAAGGMPGLSPQMIDMLTKSLTQRSARHSYEEALNHLVMKKPKTGRLDLSALQLAAGLLTPTKSGTFTEALGQALPGYVKQTQRQDLLSEAEADKQTNLRLKLLGSRATQEQGDSAQALKLLTSFYGQKPFQVRTKDGVFLVDRAGNKLKKLGDLKPSEATAPQYNYFEKEDEKLTAQAENKIADETIQDGRNAIQLNSGIDAFDVLLEQPHLEGKAAPIINDITSIAQTFGVNPDIFNLPNASAGEVMSGLGAKMVLDKTGGSLGSGISNADRDYVAAQVPKFGATDSGNKVLSKMLRKLNERKIAAMRFAQDYRVKHDSSKGLSRALDQEFNGKPLFDDAFKKEISGAVAKTGERTVGDFFKKNTGSKAARIQLEFLDGKMGDQNLPETQKKRDDALRAIGAL